MLKLTQNLGRALAHLALFGLLIIQGCKKELLQPSNGQFQNSLSITEAKQFFDANLKYAASSKGKLMATNSAHNVSLEDILNGKQPVWDQAYEKMISIGGAIKIPLNMGQTYVVVNNKTKAVVPFSTLNYLLMYKDSLNKVHAEWVLLQPDSAWLYGNRSQYTGKIIVKNWQGKTLKKYNYSSQQSIITSKKNALKATTNVDGEVPTDTSGVNICIRFRRAVEYCTCADKYHCDWRTCNVCGITLCGTIEDTCVLCDDPQPQTGETPTGGGSGGTPGGGTPPVNPGGGPGPGDYTPPDCISDPNYVDPQITNPDGSMSIPACPPTPYVPEPNTLTAAQYLINNLNLNSGEISYVNNEANFSAVNSVTTYLVNHGLTPENKEYAEWAIEYLTNDPSRYNAQFVELLTGMDAYPLAEAEDLNGTIFNLPSNPTVALNLDGHDVISGIPAADEYPDSHPVSQAIKNYNPWIYYAFLGANNTSVKHFHSVSKGLAGADGYRKALGAIGEGLFVTRVTSIPTSPGAQMYIGFMAGTTHIDALQINFLPTYQDKEELRYGLQINYTDQNGNPLQRKLYHPEGMVALVNVMRTAVAYEVKTLNVNRNTTQSLFLSFQEGINQAKHRAQLNGISASVLVFDYDCWKKLMNSSYAAQVSSLLASAEAMLNPDGENKVYLRLEKNLWLDANRAYWHLVNTIKNY